MVQLKRKSWVFIMYIYLLVFLVLFIGCGNSGKLELMQALGSGADLIEIHTPGGSFNPGDNLVAVYVIRNGEYVDLDEGKIWLHMPEMPNMPRMDTETGLTKNGNHLEGNIYFEMGGDWNGEVTVQTAAGRIIDEPLRVQVR
jgi:hypothetical protein